MPLPLRSNPIDELLFSHVKVVPNKFEVKFDAGTISPLQKRVFATALTIGLGFTITDKF